MNIALGRAAHQKRCLRYKIARMQSQDLEEWAMTPPGVVGAEKLLGALGHSDAQAGLRVPPTLFPSTLWAKLPPVP